MIKSSTIKSGTRTGGAAFALTAAALLAGCQSTEASTTGGAQGLAAGSTDLVHCSGVNACKGHNDCKSAGHSCAGQGSCKGTGFVTTPSKSCAELGGHVQGDWRGEVAKADLVQCYGVNTCKGHNDCKTSRNACAGQGACKGQGFVALQLKACGNVGGRQGA